jgi:hypothetical protein
MALQRHGQLHPCLLQLDPLKHPPGKLYQGL